MSQTPPRLPYGLADFTAIQHKQMAYVDKTSYVAELERTGEFLFFLRPRRFGKSLTVSQLYCYYDVSFADEFDELFSQTWIGQNPTPEKNSYLVLYFNFAEVDPDPQKVSKSFETYTQTMFLGFIRRYRSYLDQEIIDRLESLDTSGDRLSALFDYASVKKLKLYLLIDEYDNFTNTILSRPIDGKQTYHNITHEAGFFRHFFTVLKGGTQAPNSGLGRLFVTGVSPVTMDDVTSGYNIGSQISLSKRVAAITGFTREEVRDLVVGQGVPAILGKPLAEVLQVMETWYGGYRFCEDAAEPIFNSDMVLYFMKEVVSEEKMPREMVDHNVRIDYTKLRHLIILDKKLNGNFSRMKQVLEDGYLVSKLHTGFPLEDLGKEHNFISLLHYFGLVTINGESRGLPRLVIPNRTVASLMYGYIRDAYKDAELFQTRIHAVEKALSDMAWEGAWQPFFQLLGKAVEEQTSIRDYLSAEKVIQGFLLAWLNIADTFQTSSEREFNKGFCDLYLEPFTAKYPAMPYGYLIELKYFKRGEWSEAKQAEKIKEARDQLQQYRGDKRLEKVDGKITWICPILVFHGWELVWQGT